MSTFFYNLHFYLFGILALASAVVFVTRKSPVAAALWLVNTLFCLAALYLMLGAHFIGIIQVLVYAGAIMVVFLFVVMLLNLGHASELSDARGKVPKIVAAGLGLALLALIGVTLRVRVETPFDATTRAMDAQMQNIGAVGAVAEPLFREYLLAFEVTSLVLLVAMIGAVVLGKRRTA
jgi:NADH-quinone oxidoreductase subunit J